MKTSRPKKQKKMTLAEENRLRKKAGLPPRKRITIATIKAELKKKAKALPKEQRQRILDKLWDCLPFGAIAQEEGVDTQTVCGVMELNTYTVKRMHRETR